MYNNYKHKYYKYKKKYLKIKTNLSEHSLNTEEEFPDVEIDDEFIQEDIIITPNDTEEEDIYPITIPDEDSDKLLNSINENDKQYNIKEIGVFQLALGTLMPLYETLESDFIKFANEVNKKKILLINSLDDFDNFTYKYGAVDRYTIQNKVYGTQELLYIRWDKVENEYKGIYIDEGLQEDRYIDAIYNNKIYSSWWQRELPYKQVLIFVPPDFEEFQGKSIEFPFKGKIFPRYEFPDNNYVNIFEKPNIEKYLYIQTFRDFDTFTNKFGYLSDEEGKTIINIYWNDVKNNYKGFYLDQNSEIYPKRFIKAFFGDKKYASWWSHNKLKKGIIYSFI